MKIPACLLAGLALMAAAGCSSTPDSRISANQAAFSTWPPEVQAKVRAGMVAVGFTQEQVLVALGEPHLKSISANGPAEVDEVWVYHRHAEGTLSFAVGGASFGHGSAVGGGVAANGIPIGSAGPVGQVVFVNGRVVSFQMLGR